MVGWSACWKSLTAPILRAHAVLKSKTKNRFGQAAHLYNLWHPGVADMPDMVRKSKGAGG